MAVFKKQLECKEENPEVLKVDNALSLPALRTPLNLYSAHADGGSPFLCLQLHPKASSPNHQRVDVKCPSEQNIEGGEPILKPKQLVIVMANG